MNQMIPQKRRFLRGGTWLSIALVIFSACVSSGEKSSGTKAIENIADRMIDAAERRIDVRNLRVSVQWIHNLGPTHTSGMWDTSHGSQEGIGRRLQHEFVIALSRRLNVIEIELLTEEVEGLMAGGVSSLVTNYGITHVLVGDFVQEGNDLNVQVRLVDAESYQIVAAASGTISVRSL